MMAMMPVSIPNAYSIHRSNVHVTSGVIKLKHVGNS